MSAAPGGPSEGGVEVQRSTSGAARVRVGLATTSVLSAAVLAGCGGTSLATQPASADGAPSPSVSTEQAAPAWPDPARTVVTTPAGQRPPLAPLDEYQLIDLTTFAEQEGVPLEQVRVEQQDGELFHAMADRAKTLLGDRWSEARPAMDGQPAWIGFTGHVPAELVPLAEEYYLPVELRGGALLTEAEADLVRSPGTDAFQALAPEGLGWGANLDTPTATFSFYGYPAEVWQPGDEVRQAVVAAAREALGRDVAFRVELNPDTRDPETTQPATWFLPAGSVPDPEATSVQVLVEEDGCTSGQGAAGNIADPVVEVTDTQVRIAVSTYIRKGPQTCPGHPLAPLVVELGRPLGDRQLVDVNGAIDDDLAPSGGNLVTPDAG